MKVVIAIITCQRPVALLRLLDSLQTVEHNGEIELLVIDNDQQKSAINALAEYASALPLRTVHETKTGIPFARNAALKACPDDADYMAFLDDDEVVSAGWLRQLLAALNATNDDAVGGPVMPLLPADAPAWIRRGGFFERETHADRQPRPVLSTNNCLIRLSLWRQHPVWFDERLQFTGSSDTLFFLSAVRQGWRLTWAADALVHEHIPQQRLCAGWIIQRQWRVGNGLALCDILLDGWYRTIPLRCAKALAHTLIGLSQLLLVPLYGRAALVRAAGRLARAGGTLAALLGHRYQEYAPARLVREAV